MNKSAELITEESDTFVPSLHIATAEELGTEAARRYLQSRASSGEEGEESILPEIAGNAMAAAFMFGILLGRYVRQ
jgi:hypothetical protein